MILVKMFLILLEQLIINLWHRVSSSNFGVRNYQNTYEDTIKPDIQADFWNGDPDIDAICRMEHAPECNLITCFPFSSNKSAPLILKIHFC